MSDDKENLGESVKTSLKNPQTRKWILYGLGGAGILAIIFYANKNRQAASQPNTTGLGTLVSQTQQNQTQNGSYNDLAKLIYQGMYALAQGLHGENVQLAGSQSEIQESIYDSQRINASQFRGIGLNFQGTRDYVTDLFNNPNSTILGRSVLGLSTGLTSANQNIAGLNQASYFSVGAQSFAACIRPQAFHDPRYPPSITGIGKENWDTDCLKERGMIGITGSTGDLASDATKNWNTRLTQCRTASGDIDFSCVGRVILGQ